MRRTKLKIKYSITKKFFLRLTVRSFKIVAYTFQNANGGWVGNGLQVKDARYAEISDSHSWLIQNRKKCFQRIQYIFGKRAKLSMYFWFFLLCLLRSYSLTNRTNNAMIGHSKKMILLGIHTVSHEIFGIFFAHAVDVLFGSGTLHSYELFFIYNGVYEIFSRP